MKKYSIVGLVMFFILSTQIFTQPPKSESLAHDSQSLENILNRELAEIKTTFYAVKNIKGEKTIKSFLEPFNNLEMLIDRSLNRCSLYQAVHPDEKVREISARYQQEIEKISTQIELSEEIFNALLELDLSKEKEDTHFYVNKLIRNFKRAGMDKDAKTREKISALQDAIVVLGQEFSKNIREDVRFIELELVQDLAGLPQDFIDNHRPDETGKIRITTDYPDLQPFMRYAESDKKRKELSRINRQRGYPKNEKILSDLIAKRYELANLLGYENWASYITGDKMIENAEAAATFIDKVSDISEKKANDELDILLKYLQKEIPDAEVLGRWQYSYISGKVEKDLYNFDARKLREYFPYETVKEGLFKITEQMYNIRYKKVDQPGWHENVECYEIVEHDQVIGRFYLDMHPRPNKYKHAMTTEIVSGIKGKQIPVGALVCNFPGGDGTAGLMEHNQVSTFFHEFGHLLHFLFAGHQRWYGITGISVEWDFVETPAILFQEWTWDPEILKMFARNNQGEIIPDELIKKLLATRHFGIGIFNRQQMFYASLSLWFHNQKQARFDQIDLLKKMQKKYSPYPYLDDTYMHLSFGHLNGYSAIYYTYMWSGVIARDVFSVFEKNGLMNRKINLSYKEKVLAPGGSKKASDLIRDFLNRAYSFDAFEKFVNSN